MTAEQRRELREAIDAKRRELELVWNGQRWLKRPEGFTNKAKHAR